MFMCVCVVEQRILECFGRVVNYFKTVVVIEVRT